MNIHQFPHHYAASVKDRAARDVRRENERSASRKEEIQKSILPSVYVGAWTSNFLAIGFVIGFFVCCTMCFKNSSTSGFVTMLAVAIGVMLLGTIIGLICKAVQKNSVTNADKETSNESDRCWKAVQDINTKAECEIAEYTAKFESMAQTMSVQYADSELAQEVIDWMSDGFCRTINSVSRASHIEQINVPFVFHVYSDKIDCNLGLYDFNVKRCANLESPLQQAALARAIASAIQLNVTMHFPQDPSGTDFMLNLDYDFSSNYVSARITYIAPNGNYRAVQQW